MMLHWSHEGTDCAGCHSPVRIPGEHRVVVGHAVWHEVCYVSSGGVVVIGDWLR